MTNNIINLAKEFNEFLKKNSAELLELEQANFIFCCNGYLDLEKLVNKIIKNELKILYKNVIFADFDFYVNKIKNSHYSFIDKKNMLLLLIATRCEKYRQTFFEEIRADEREFLVSYLEKVRFFIDFCINDENNKELSLFLLDINAFRKILKNDSFIMPVMLKNAFNWAFKEQDDYKKNLENTKNILFNSRRKFYYKLDLHKNTIKNYQIFSKKIDELLHKF